MTLRRRDSPQLSVPNTQPQELLRHCQLPIGSRWCRAVLAWMLLPATLLAALPAAAGAGEAVGSLNGELVLANAAGAALPIVVFADAPPYTRQAAEELADVIAKMTGVRPEVIEGLPDPLPERAIWVGYQPVLDDLLPDIDFDFAYPEEVLIAANQHHLVIAGRDRWNPDQMRVEYPRPRGKIVVMDGVQLEYGTANAVYTFMQDFLGVRWFWPGENGEDVLEQEVIALDPFEYRYHPQIRSRGGMFVYSTFEVQSGHSQDWARRQRVLLDSMNLDTSHAFKGWWDRFGESNPEYFALQPDGTRGGSHPFPGPGSVKICKSNPAVWEQWLSDVGEQMERNPNKTVFSAAVNDGGFQGYCTCDDCRAWDHPEAEMVRTVWRGLAAEYAAQSDRQVTFANTLARLLRERYPDRELYVTVMAYGNSRPVPAAAVPDDNVIVSAVFNFHNRTTFNKRNQNADDHRRMFLDWAAMGFKNLAWRPNLGAGAGWQMGMPNVAPRRVIEDFRLAADNNVTALYFDAVWEHWANQGPHYYMMAQMAWNPYADGEAILDDYYQRAFGPAESPMRRYWEFIDTTSDAIVMDNQMESDVWDAAFYSTAYGYLNAAKQAAVDAPEKYRQRIDFVQAGLDFMRLYFDTTKQIERLRQSDGQDAVAEAAARANWEEIDTILTNHPHAFDPTRIATPTERGGNGRMLRIHPDHYTRFK